MRRVVLAGVAVAVMGAGSVAFIGYSGARDEDNERRTRPSSTANVERRDLVETETLDGTLGFVDQRPLMAGLNGTLTAVPDEGTRIRRGGTLYEIDGRPVRLLSGNIPQWRSFESGMDDGRDVRQLERNLVALGYDPDGDIDVDEQFDKATEAAIKRWEDDLGLTEDGTIEMGEVVFLPGARRVGEVEADIGTGGMPETEIMTTSSWARAVTIELDPARRDLVRRGKKVDVEMPDGSATKGRVASVGKVAQVPDSDSNDDPYVEVVVRLPSDATGLEGAPVDVTVVQKRTKDALAVPAAALLALAEGGYALEVVSESGESMLVPVETGTFADGWVEVDGDIAEGAEVVMPE